MKEEVASDAPPLPVLLYMRPLGQCGESLAGCGGTELGPLSWWMRAGLGIGRIQISGQRGGGGRDQDVEDEDDGAAMMT